MKIKERLFGNGNYEIHLNDFTGDEYDNHIELDFTTLNTNAMILGKIKF